MKFLSYAESELLITPEDLARQLITKMDRLGATQPNAGNDDWTPEVKSYLRDIARALDRPAENLSIEVIYTKVAPGTKEFLLDVVWWARRGSGLKQEWMGLAAEIEWASTRPWSSGNTVEQALRSCVAEDFAKLLVVKSPLKLMIFCTGQIEESHEPMRKVVFEEIDKNLDPYHDRVPGENYIFIDAASNGHRRAWLQTVDVNGALSSRTEVILQPTP